jgi:hypothetical protein
MLGMYRSMEQSIVTCTYQNKIARSIPWYVVSCSHIDKMFWTYTLSSVGVEADTIVGVEA